MAKIVVVDDEAGICKYVAGQLRKEGHEVEVSVTGDGAIDLGHLFRPDVVVADFCLRSDYNGLEVAEAIQAINRNVKVIMITAFPTMELYERLNSHAIVQLLVKPFSLDEISKAVCQAVQLARFHSPFSDN